MARNIGSIEVEVEANTGRLKAQLSKQGRTAGKALADAIEEEIDNLQGDLAKIDGSKEAKALKLDIEKQLRNLAANVEPEVSREALEDASAELKKWREKEEMIEFALEAVLDKSSTEKVAAKLKQMEEDDRVIAFNLNLFNEDVLAELERMEAQEHTTELLVELDAKFAKAEKEKLEEDIRIEALIDLKQANAELEKMRVKQERDRLGIPILADLDEFDRNISEMRARMAATSVDIKVMADATRAVADVKMLKSDIENGWVEIKTQADLAAARAQLAAFREVQQNNDIEIPVDIDVDSLDAALAKIEKKMAVAGKKSSDEFGDGFGSGLLSGDNTKLIIAAVLSMGDALGAGLSGLLASALSIVSTGVEAVVGAAGAAVPIIVAMGGALTAGVVGAVGFGDALKVVNDEFAKAKAKGDPLNKTLIAGNAAFLDLAPSARKAALAFADVRDELAASQKLIQQELFKGLDKEINDLTKNTLPGVTDALRIAATSVNEFGREMSGVVQQTDFKALMLALDPALDDAFDSATAFAGVLEPFLLAAAPVAEELADWIERGAEHMRDWVSVNPTAITDTLANGVDSLKLWGELLGSTAGLLATIFDAGKASGDGFLVSVNNIIERWDAWLESDAGAKSLENFFDTGKSAVEAFKPVFDGLKEAFEILVNDDTMGSFHELGTALGEAIPVIAEIIALFGELGTINAISNILVVVGPLVDALGDLPPEILEIIGQFIVLVGIGSKVKGAFDAIKLAMTGLTTGNAVLIGITAAASVALVAFNAFKGKTDEVAERTKELTRALENSVDAIVASGDASSDAAVGMQALSEAIFTAGEDGDKLKSAFGEINSGAGDASLGIGDTVTVLGELKSATDGGKAALTKLATGYGLSEDAARQLAEIVASTDDNIRQNTEGFTDRGDALRKMATDEKLSEEQIFELAGALEEVQDQAEKTDIQAVAQAFLDSASTSDEATQAMLAQAEATAGLNGQANDSVAIYNLYTAALNKAKNASDDSTEANNSLTSSQELIKTSIDDAIAAHEAAAVALKAERDAAFASYEAQLQLAEQTENAAVALAANMGIPYEFADGLAGIGNSARDAAAEAGHLQSALNLLLDPSLSLQEAASNLEQNIDDLTDSMKTNGATLDLTTQAGRDNAEQLRTSITGITDYAAAQLTAGVSNEEVAASALAARDALIEQSLGYFEAGDGADNARLRAEDYFNQLGLTPELISTVFSQPGLVDSLLNAEDLTLLYDKAGNPVITEFEAQGIDPASADVEGFQTLVEGLNKVVGSPSVEAPTIPVVKGDIKAVETANKDLDNSVAEPEVKYDNTTVLTKIKAVQTAIDKLDLTVATPTITMSTYTTIKTNLSNLQTAMDTLDVATATPTISMPTYTSIKTNIDSISTALTTLDAVVSTPDITIPSAATAKTAVDALDTAIDNISDGYASITVSGVQWAIDKVNELDYAIDHLTTSKTVTITQRTVNSTASMAGRIVNGPTSTTVGERGYSEAIIPLQLPLNRVDPSVRHFAEALRGGVEGKQGAGSTKTVNNYLTIQPQSADPSAVATQVINRAASLANR